MPETTPLIKAALNLRVGVGFDVYVDYITTIRSLHSEWIDKNKEMIDRDKGSVDDKKVLDKFQWFLQQID